MRLCTLFALSCLVGCGGAAPEALMSSAERVTAPSLPEGAFFGTSFALQGDLLAVNCPLRSFQSQGVGRARP